MNTSITKPFAALLLGACLAYAAPSRADDPPPRPTADDCPTKIKKADRAAGKLIDLNTATPRQIEQIPWVGKKTARVITDRRKSVGSFKSMEQLHNVKGVGDKAYACLLMYAMVEPVVKPGVEKKP